MAILIFYALNPSIRTRATIAASSLSLLVALGLCLLSHGEHIRSVTPSAIINVYLLLTLPFDIARARTLWLNTATGTIAAVFTSGLAVKLMIVITEAIEKRSILIDRYRHASQESTSGIYSRSSFWWLNALMSIGHKRILFDKDLYPIDEEMNSKTLHRNAQKTWNTANRQHPRALLWTILKTNRLSLISAVFPRLCLIGFKYAQPFLLTRTVRFAGSPHELDSVGWGLTGAFGLALSGAAVANGTYQRLTYRFVTQIRGTLVSLIYFKTIDLSITALDDSIAVTLMSSDTEAICEGFKRLHELWSAPVEAAIAMYLLYRQLGWAFLAPAVIALLSTLGIMGVAGYMGSAQKIWIQGIQTRVAHTAIMLASMKGIKMLGFVEKMTEIIEELRMKEIRLSKHFRRLLWVRVTLSISNRCLAPLVTLICFVISTKYTGSSLDVSAAFTSISLVSLLATAMQMLIPAIPMINASMACIRRTQSFLNSSARKDNRLDLEKHSPKPHSRGTANIFEMHDCSSAPNVTETVFARNASFSWTLKGSPTISDTTFTILKGQVCFIIGPVGSGKTTLLKGLLGETLSSQGFVYTGFTSAAYVGQTPWIQSGTIRDNITGVGILDEDWYQQVLHACALEHDVLAMPKGKDTQVGSAGISLSGGQKQRIALARAVYSKKEIVILDDVFSGLDAETEEQVFSRLLGKQGLFRQLKTTVILTTHAVSRLSYSDHIIVLDTGRIIEQGSYKELFISNGYVQGLDAKIKTQDGSNQTTPEPWITSDVRAPISTGAGDFDTQVDELNRQTGDFQIYKYYIAAIGWRNTSIFLLFCGLYGASLKFTDFLLIYWTRAVARQGNSANPFYLGMYALLSGLSMLAFMFGTLHYLLRVIPKTAELFHRTLLETVMAAPLSFFSATETGAIANRFSQDLMVIDEELPDSLIDLMLSLAVAIMVVVLISLSANYFLAIIPIIILAVWILQKFYLRTSRQIRLLDLEAKSPLYSHFLESLNGLVTIRAFGWTEDFQENNLRLLDASQKPYYLLFCIQQWLALVLDLMVAGITTILMVMVVKLRVSIGPGQVGLALLNVMNFSQFLAQVITYWTSLETSLGAIARIKSFSETTANENLPAETQPLPDNWPAHGAIEFENVSASYKSDGHLVVQDLNLSIKPGEKIGICGRGGSGKSSLITTLFRMLELTSESRIIIDGIDISTIPRQLVRSRLNAIPQEPFFLKGTIRFNLDPYSIHADTALISALTSVHLWTLILAKSPTPEDPLSTLLDAEFFSHGQRQLFCLARAILLKSKIVVLDEATSSVDTESDTLMQTVIREEFKECTVIAVAHRLDTILEIDRVVLLEGGVVGEVGVPTELLMREDGGKFRDLYYS